ncbi:MAG: carbohydrate ABC transporter permease [Anaerolineales bacterium]|nr:MAG: carbohydrate ABC transporter permease [Anaerolineales bacterium]
MKKRLNLGRVVIYTLLIVGSIIMAYPLVYAVMGSLSTIEDYIASPIMPIPRHFYLENYTIMLTADFPIFRWIFNTLIRIVWYITIPGIASILGGYAFSRIQFRGRETVFSYLLSSMMLPGIVFWIPTYIMMARFPGAGGNNWLGQGGSGFINKWPSLLIPGLVSVYYIFLMRQTFYSIPEDFEEAARIDGANTMQIMWYVYLPMLKPTLTVMVLFQFVAQWNDYQWPLIVSSGNPAIYTLALGVQRALLTGASLKGWPQGTAIIDYPFTFALATVASVPTILLFLWLQDYFVEGVQGFSIKG